MEVFGEGVVVGWEDEDIVGDCYDIVENGDGEFIGGFSELGFYDRYRTGSACPKGLDNSLNHYRPFWSSLRCVDAIQISSIWC